MFYLFSSFHVTFHSSKIVNKLSGPKVLFHVKVNVFVSIKMSVSYIFIMLMTHSSKDSQLVLMVWCQQICINIHFALWNHTTVRANQSLKYIFIVSVEFLIFIRTNCCFIQMQLYSFSNLAACTAFTLFPFCFHFVCVYEKQKKNCV